MKKYTNTQKINGEMAVRRLSAKAKEVYYGTDPMNIYEIETEDGPRYDVGGGEEAKGLTFEALEQFLESLQDEMEDWEW